MSAAADESIDVAGDESVRSRRAARLALMAEQRAAERTRELVDLLLNSVDALMSQVRAAAEGKEPEDTRALSKTLTEHVEKLTGKRVYVPGISFEKPNTSHCPLDVRRSRQGLPTSA